MAAQPIWLEVCRDTMDPEFVKKPRKWSAKLLGVYM